MAESNDFAVGYAMGQDGNGNNGCNNGMWGGDWIWAFLIFALFGWGNGGFGGFGGNNGGGYVAAAATQADIQRGFDTSAIIGKLDGISQGICDGFYAVNASLMNGFHGVDNAICNLGYNVQQGFNATQLAMLQGQNALSTQLAQCCCDNRAGQKDIQYQMATDTCAVTTALANNTRDIIDNQNANYRGLMDFMVQSKIDALQSENQALRLSASQQAQNTVIGAMIDASRAEILRYPLCAAVLLPAHGACPACALIAEAPVILDRTGQVQRRFYFPHFLAVRVVRRGRER